MDTNKDRQEPVDAALQSVRAAFDAGEFTQSALAQQTGISGASISRMLNGLQRPSAHTLSAMCRALGLPWGPLPYPEGGSRDYPMVENGPPVRLPIVGRASAVPHANIVWEPIDPPEWKALPPNAVLIEVRGDSMRPLVWPGQCVLAVPADGPPAAGSLVVAELTDGRQVFKRGWGGERVTLESLRTDQPEEPLVLRRRDIRRVWRIVGVLF